MTSYLNNCFAECAPTTISLSLLLWSRVRSAGGWELWQINDLWIHMLWVNDLIDLLHQVQFSNQLTRMRAELRRGDCELWWPKHRAELELSNNLLPSYLFLAQTKEAELS